MVQQFQQTLLDHALHLQRSRTHTLQVNVGYRYNLACKHCHVHGGPNRQEVMTRYTFANVPLGRFQIWLEQTGNLESYIEKLVLRPESFDMFFGNLIIWQVY